MIAIKDNFTGKCSEFIGSLCTAWLILTPYQLLYTNLMKDLHLSTKVTLKNGPTD